MNFKVGDSTQSARFETKIKAAFYKELHIASTKSGWVRLTGLGVGIVSGLLNIVKRIALFAENIIKGLINIFGSCFSKKYEFCWGMNQLVLQTSKHIIMLPVEVCRFICEIFSNTINMALKPVQHTQECWFKYDPVVARKLLEAAQKQEFNNNIAIFNADKTNLAAAKIIADCYATGTGVDKSEAQAFEYYLRAAKRGNVASMLMSGTYLMEGTGIEKSERAACHWFRKAADAGDMDASTMLAQCLDIGKGVPLDKAEALTLYKKAAAANHPLAMCHLGIKEANNKHYSEAVTWLRKAIRYGENTFSKPYLVAILMRFPKLQTHPLEQLDIMGKMDMDSVSKIAEISYALA